MSLSISEEIKRLRGTYVLDGETPQSINNGFCGDFAAILWENGYGDGMWGDEVCPILWSMDVILKPFWFEAHVGGHCFTLYNGRYYDSECPDGVAYPDHLPFYQREKQWIKNNT